MGFHKKRTLSVTSSKITRKSAALLQIRTAKGKQPEVQNKVERGHRQRGQRLPKGGGKKRRKQTHRKGIASNERDGGQTKAGGPRQDDESQWGQPTRKKKKAKDNRQRI